MSNNTKIAEMVDLQHELQKRIFKERLHKDFDNLSNEDIIFYVMDSVYFVEEELHEMARELPFCKHWKTYATDDISAHKQLSLAQKEYADVIHFAINLSLLLNIDLNKFDIPETKRYKLTMQERTNTVKYQVLNTYDSLRSLMIAFSEFSQATTDNLLHQFKSTDNLYKSVGATIGDLLIIAGLLNLSKLDIYDLYLDKNKINHERQDGGY